MLANLLTTFAKKALYGLAGNTLFAIGDGIAHHVPVGNAIVVYLWQSLAVGALTGAVAAGKRLLSWDPNRNGHL